MQVKCENALLNHSVICDSTSLRWWGIPVNRNYSADKIKDRFAMNLSFFIFRIKHFKNYFSIEIQQIFI